jgi:acyl-CoA thioester hydrolase
MGKLIETHRGVIYPWQCDHQGHLNTAQYVGIFDSAFWHHVSAMGFTRAYLGGFNRGFVDVKDVLEYQAEVVAGSLIVVESVLLRIGGKSITARHRMRDAETGERVATSEKTAVYFDLGARRAVSLPDDKRQAMEEFLES